MWCLLFSVSITGGKIPTASGIAIKASAAQSKSNQNEKKNTNSHQHHSIQFHEPQSKIII